MNIIWNKNPLHTVIQLSESEQAQLILKLKIKELEEITTNAYFTLDKHDWYNKTIKPRTIEETITEVKSTLNPSYIYNEDDYVTKGIDARVQEIFKSCLYWAGSEHIGDCICVACPCSKCYIEGILNINTIEGLDKHAAHMVKKAYGKENERSIQEVLEYLKNYEPKANWDGWQAYADKWKADANRAYDWLMTYSKAHPEIVNN